MKIDVYNVLDDDGNVIDTLRYPEGGSLYENAKRNRESGQTNFIYESEGTDPEKYVSTLEAKTDVQINPFTNEIVVSGPKWLVDDVVNSESFQKNWSKNNVLKQLVSAYNTDPLATLPDESGGSKTVAEILGDYEGAANDFASAFPYIKNVKMSAEYMYGVNLSDGQASEILTGYDKTRDYDKDGAVFIPEWALDNYDWGSLGSWNPDKKTVSAQDFFRLAYNEGWDNNTASSLQEESAKMMQGLVNYNTFDSDDEANAAAKSEIISSNEYAEEVARTMHMYNLVKGNRPEVDASLHAAMLVASTSRNMMAAIQNANYNISESITQTIEAFNETVGIDQGVNKLNPVYLAAGLLGELTDFVSASGYSTGASPREGLTEYFNGLIDSWKSIEDGKYGSYLQNRHEEFTEAFEKMQARNENIYSWWGLGEFLGNTLWKVAENVMLLNVIGGKVESVIKAAGAAKFVVRGLGNLGLSSSTVANIFKAAGVASNITTQSLFETLIDDKQLLDKALASGELTDELVDKIRENLIWNTFGELMGPTSRWFFDNTTAGKAAAMAMAKPVALVSKYGHGFLYSIAKTLNKNLDSAAKAAEAGKPFEYANTIMHKLKSEVADQVLHAPIFRSWTEAENAALSKKVALVLFGREAIISGETLATATEKIAQKTGLDASDVLKAFQEASDWNNITVDDIVHAFDNLESSRGTAESISNQINEATKEIVKENNDAAAAAEKTISGRIGSNYKKYKDLVLIRANLENSVDMLSKGVSIKESEINRYASVNRMQYQDSARSVQMAEAKLEEAGVNLTRKAGYVFSQESANYMGYSVEIKRAQWLIDNGKLTGKELEAAKTFVEAATERISAIRGVLGDELCAMLDGHVLKSAAYTKSIIDYMIINGYADEDYKGLIRNLRNNMGWGPNGETYIPSVRMAESDSAQGWVDSYIKKMEDGDLFKRSDTVLGNPYRYDWNAAKDFLDPTTTIEMYLRGAATTAQAADFGRAVLAANIPLKGVSVDADGIPKPDKNTLSIDIKRMRKDAIYKLQEGDLFKAKIRDAVGRTKIFKEGLSKRAEVVQTSGELIEDQRAVNTASNKGWSLFHKKTDFSHANVQRAGFELREVRNVNKILSFADESDLDLIISESKKDVPIFDPKEIKAADFKEWWSSIETMYGKGKAAKAAGARLRNGIEEQLGVRKANVTNVRKAFKENEGLSQMMKVNFILFGDKSMRDSKVFKDVVMGRIVSVLTANEQETLAKAAKSFDAAIKARDAAAQKLEALGGAKGQDWKASFTYGEDFAEAISDAHDEILDEAVAQLMKDPTFEKGVAYMVSLGVPDGVAREYLALSQLKTMKPKFFADALKESKNGKSAAIKEIRDLVFGKEAIVKEAKNLPLYDISNKISDAFGEGIHKNFERSFNACELVVRKYNAQAIDLDAYFESVEKEVNDIYKMGFSVDEKTGNINYDRKKYVQLTSPVDNKIRFYQLDPLYADLVNNASPSFFYKQGTKHSPLVKFALKFNQGISRIFRFGTTGIDRTSYVNQWFRDSQNAISVGGALPFSDFRPRGISGLFNNMRKDFGLRFGTGNEFSQEVTAELVSYTFKSTEDSLRVLYGQDWLDAFKESVTNGKTGKAVEETYERALVEFAISDSGAKALPGMGGITQVELYNPKTNQQISPNDLRKEFFASLNGEGISGQETLGIMRRLGDSFSDLADGIQRGSWRESMLRQSVFASQYRAAIDSGMTAREAKIWATRYALDATTDFGRTFAYANDFIKSIPYLSAGINGTKSFFRLLELDPEGVSTRITFGLVLPFMSLLSESLSDPKSKEAYMNIPEYEKEDNLVFFYNGSKVSIPVPQEISGFFAPFRHVVEKMANANDHSWTMLAASDILGIMPLDLSGFVNLDANTLLGAGEEFSFSRGVEKAAASLMPPAVKSAYMVMTGKDPYTGQEIDRSYKTTDADGNIVIMDSTTSETSLLLHRAIPGLSASAWYQVLKSMTGRSGVMLLDEIHSLFIGVKGLTDEENAKYAKQESFLERYANDMAGGYTNAITGDTYDKGAKDWRAAIGAMYDEKEKLKVNEELQKSLTVLRNSKSSDTQKQGALRTYEEITSEYRYKILEIAKAVKEKYPEEYTSKRLAQVISVLTLPTDAPYLETAYNTQLSREMYDEAREEAISTFLKMGFPADTTDVTELGAGRYTKQGEYKFEIFTPYQIEAITKQYYNADERINASIDETLEKAGIKTSDMWDGYYKAKEKGKSALKQYKSDWNYSVIKTLYPLSQLYGAHTFTNNKSTQNLLKNYIFVDNPYKTKEYMLSVFGGDE